MLSKQQYHTGGPFRAEQLRVGDPYELDDGHPIECLPSGRRHAKASLTGGLVLATDPPVESVGFDTGYTPDEQNLRAPNIAVGHGPGRSGLGTRSAAVGGRICRHRSGRAGPPKKDSGSG